MLTLGYTRAARPMTFLGEQRTEDYGAVPAVVMDRVGYLARAHAALQRSATQIAAMAKDSQLPVDPLVTYNSAIDTVLPAVKAFLQGDGSASNPGYLNAPGVESSTPVYAAKIAISDPTTGELVYPDSATLAGFGGAGGFVDSSNIRFVREGRSGVEVLTAEQMAQEFSGGELGGLVLPIIIIATVLVVAVGILWTISDVSAQVTIQEQQRAWAKSCDAVARTTEAVTASYYKVYNDCAVNATTVEQKAACMKAASDAAVQVAKSVPGMPAFPPTGAGEGRSWLWWIGLAVVIAAVAVGGYAIYKRRKRTQAVEVVETATEAKAVPAEA